ncbi:PilZ domain-containing protein [Altererythrobacter sp. Z27]|uniref:PilZ domain-containing protein n=1 Tax=Altererythrobacter sp. Z27 TaxID=3461147 RepID=UPI0040439F12
MASQPQLIWDDRLSPRYQLFLDAKLIQGNASLDTAIVNLSDTGVMVKLRGEDFAAGQGEKLYIRASDSISRPVSVVWVANGLLGAEFDQRLTQGEVAAARLIAETGSPNKTKSNGVVQNNSERDLGGLREAADGMFSRTARLRIFTGMVLSAWAFTILSILAVRSLI